MQVVSFSVFHISISPVFGSELWERCISHYPDGQPAWVPQPAASRTQKQGRGLVGGIQSPLTFSGFILFTFLLLKNKYHSVTGLGGKTKTNAFFFFFTKKLLRHCYLLISKSLRYMPHSLKSRDTS